MVFFFVGVDPQSEAIRQAVGSLKKEPKPSADCEKPAQACEKVEKKCELKKKDDKEPESKK